MRPVAELLPQQPPMRLLDQVLAHDTQQIYAISAVSGVPFTTAQGLPAWFGLELMAQAAAAFFTLQATQQAPPRQGMLIACPRFTTSVSHYAAEQVLLIHARLASRLPDNAAAPALVKFDGEITTLDDTIAPPSLTATGFDPQNVRVEPVSQASLSVYL